LSGREKVDVVVGTVHSGVAMAMVKVARDTNTMLIIPNAGANEATGPLACAPNIFRTSFSNWQTTVYPAWARCMVEAGHQECRHHHLALRGGRRTDDRARSRRVSPRRAARSSKT
jgi:hypothetical protein